VGKKSTEFEKLIQRVQMLKEDSTAVVEHDGQIADPDDPQGDLRQIDVLLIRDGGCTTAVECRDRGKAQSVMWVEELIGRKISLGLDGMIGVSAKGFSRLARIKAQKHGIQLYDLPSLKDDEIASWGERVEVTTTFVQFDTLALGVVVDQAHQARLTANPVLTYQGRDGVAHVMDQIRDVAVVSPGQVHSGVIPETDFLLDGIPLSMPVTASFKGQLVTQKATCTSARAYGVPGEKTVLRTSSVQRFDHTVDEVILAEDRASLRIDVSAIQAPDNAILHAFSVEFPRKVAIEGYEIVGSRRLYSKATRVSILVHGAQPPPLP
jgi:hypothetical protein